MVDDDWDESSERLKQLYLRLSKEEKKDLLEGNYRRWFRGTFLSRADVKTLAEIAETLRE